MGKLLDMYVDAGLTVHDLRWKLPVHPVKRWGERKLSDVLLTVIHHSAAKPEYTANGIAAYHVRLGWPGIAYTYYVHPNGVIDFCHRLVHHGPQTGSMYHNKVSYGVCCAGNYVNVEPSAVMIDSLVKLVNTTNRFLVEEGAQQPYIVPHREISATACPGKVWNAFLQKIKT